MSANLMGLFFIGLLIFDMSANDWGNLPVHASIGILVTLIYTFVCFLLGEEISAAILFVPAIFLFAFLLASWLLRNNLKENNCCINCTGVRHTPASSVPKCPTPKV